jgi:hypothetical protein
LGTGDALRDSKFLRFDMGMGAIYVSPPDRRDRLSLLQTLVIALLTLLDAATKAWGYGRYRASKVTARRAHPLFGPDDMFHELSATMPELRLLPLIERPPAVLAELQASTDGSETV